MWKLFSSLALGIMIAILPGRAEAFPSPKPAGVERVTSSAVPAGYRKKEIWRKYPRHHDGHRYRHHRHHHHGHRYRYYPPYYYPYYGWNDCGPGFSYGYGFGFGTWPYGCYGGGYAWGYGDVYRYERRHYRASSRKHHKWCQARYKTYNPRTGLFVGKGKKKYRCNSPYDGR